MSVLVLCEFSGRVREAFRRKGHEAYSCDLLPAEDGSPFHLRWDALAALHLRKWDLVIAHPPCTYLANSGARWLYHSDGTPNLDRWQKMRDGADFLVRLWGEGPAKMAIEQPIMHRHARERVGIDPAQTIQPWQFGHGETKATQLRLRGLPPLIPTNIVSGREQRIWRLPPGPDRQRERSRTYQGIADAMASQWA